MNYHKHSEHKTTQSYVIGYLLSLIFTVIPYYLVTNQIISGKALLLTILGFGVLQMIIQVTFFLHLGRGPKPKWNLYFFASTVSIILVVVGGSVIITSNLRGNMTTVDKTKKLVSGEGIYQIGGEKTGACQGNHANHQITIQNGKVNPVDTIAAKCDTISFINEDEDPREITFGVHPEHRAYAGEHELMVRKGRAKTITLSEHGTFQFHDHLDPDIAGYFTVTP
jgi:cytochrome o ubiquinol oxidase subunit IV